MGLDMYLTKEIYVKNWDHQKPEDKHTITVKKGGKTRMDIKPHRICGIIEELGYWRKANSIHNWFVQNVQGGHDECQKSYVSRDQLEELLGLVEAALASPLKASTLLPTVSGFFFGSGEYDEYYIEDLRRTKKILTTAIKDDARECYDTTIYYQSSW